jgi:hypothetical protein
VKNKKRNPAGSKFTALKQICNFIPGHLVPKLARETGAAGKARDFSNWSHVVALLHAQVAHSIGLNDVCDCLQLNRGALAENRGLLGHKANAVRWQVWMALLTYVLLRYLSFLSKWNHSFTRLFTIARAGVMAQNRSFRSCCGAMGQQVDTFGI